MKRLFVFFVLMFLLIAAKAQTSTSKGGASWSFIDYQKSFPRPSEALRKKEDTLMKQFAEKKIPWPAKYIYIRSFKYDSQLEVWVKNEITAPFQLFKTYKVCALAGSLGPKRMQGDFQVPEGFYFISVFNPQSNFYLSLGINYPNCSDKILSDSLEPGGDIFIHGNCVTVGCIPITDDQIEEVYVLAAYAKDGGQDFIPVHIFPIRFNVEKSVQYFEKQTRDDKVLKKFAEKLEDAFDYFEKHKQLPVVLFDTKGEYIINDVPPRKPKTVVEEKPVILKIVSHRTRDVGVLAEAVSEWPQYPGGHDALIKFIGKLGKDMASFLPAGMSKADVEIEFVVDKDGVPVNFKVTRGVNEKSFIDELIARMENIGTWKPAMLNGKPVAKKMVQLLKVEGKKKSLPH